MLLSARFLTDVANVNSFSQAAQLRMGEGEALTVYIQLVDVSKDRAEQGFVPAGRRFVPAAGATLQVQLQNIDGSKVITKNASVAFSGLDRSIWSFTIASTDAVVGTVGLGLILNESGKITKGFLQAAILSQPLTGVC